MEKRFWRMKPEEAQAFVDTHGLERWKAKIAEDRGRAAEEFSGMPNP